MIIQQLKLVQITSPHFCAGIVIEEDVCTYAAPILRYMIDWDTDKIRQYCKNRNWKAKILR